MLLNGLEGDVSLEYAQGEHEMASALVKRFGRASAFRTLDTLVKSCG
jgi:hypothetical protein